MNPPPVVATPPLRIYTDCLGTLKCLKNGRAYATEPNNPRAHLWCRFWGQFEGEDVLAFKTLAHAKRKDVEAELTTEWEMRANSLADQYAKQGARLHLPSKAVVSDYFALVHLVQEAGRWAGIHEAWLTENGIADYQDILDPPLKSKPKQGKEPVRQEAKQ